MATQSTAVHPDVLYPLSMFRLTRGIPRLKYETIEGGEVPQPYLDLLVHSGDMTSRLEEFHGGSIQVRKLSSSSDGRAYFREVVLNTVPRGKPVEYGAIEIDLANLPEENSGGDISCRASSWRHSERSSTFLFQRPSGFSQSDRGCRDQGSSWSG